MAAGREMVLWLLYIATVGAGYKTQVQVLVPSTVHLGSTVTLLCLHNLTTADLYSVKWYRGNYEFYRYLPKERPPAATFPLPGLEVDLNGSSGQQVTVRVLTTHISGRFTCEVSAEEPNFSTSSASANLTVQEMGLRKPLLLAASSVHLSGTPLQVNCSAQATVPPPKISFYIDDLKVPKHQVRVLGPGLATLETTRLGQHGGAVWLRCEASVAGVYLLSSASVPIMEQHSPSGAAIANTPSSAVYKCLMLTCLTILLWGQLQYTNI